MWLLPLLVILVWTLTGCATSPHSPPLATDQLGTAVDCDWDTGQPRNCLIDSTRATIDVERLDALLDALERCHTENMKRRRL